MRASHGVLAIFARFACDSKMFFLVSQSTAPVSLSSPGTSHHPRCVVARATVSHAAQDALLCSRRNALQGQLVALAALVTGGTLPGLLIGLMAGATL